jgi:hypothetical protein
MEFSSKFFNKLPRVKNITQHKQNKLVRSTRLNELVEGL